MYKKQAVGRPREFDEQEILGKLMNIFWEKGYEDTSLSDIITITGIKKGSLYAAFGDKHEMYLKALRHYETEAVDAVCQYLKSDDSPKDRLDTFLSSPIEATFTHNDTKGCFLCNASADRAAFDKETHALVCRGYDKLEHALAGVVKEMKPDWSEEQIIARAQLLLTAYSGLRIMARGVKKKALFVNAKNAALEF